MIDIVYYISNELSNPAAAEKLALELIESARHLSESPYLHPVHVPVRNLIHEYRKLRIRNYMIFYRVEEKTKTDTIARVVYSRRDY